MNRKRLTTWGAALACASAGMLGAATPATAATKAVPKNNYVHFPGSFAATRGACLTTLSNFERGVRASGGTVGGHGTNPDSELTSCFVTAKGWTYDVAYSRATPMFPQDMKVSGGFATSSIVGGLKLTQAQAQQFAQYTSPNFEYRKEYPTLAQCQTAFKQADAKLKSMTNAGQIDYATPGPWTPPEMDAPSPVTFSCSKMSSDYGGSTSASYEFDLQWSGPTNITYPTPGATTWEVDNFHSTYTDASGQQVMADGPEVYGKVLDDGTWAKTS